MSNLPKKKIFYILNFLTQGAYKIFTSIPLVCFTGLPHLLQTSVVDISALDPELQVEQIFRSSSPIEEGKWYSWEDKPPIFPVDPTTINYGIF